jgi:hypothetical protein
MDRVMCVNGLHWVAAHNVDVECWVCMILIDALWKVPVAHIAGNVHHGQAICLSCILIPMGLLCLVSTSKCQLASASGAWSQWQSMGWQC